MNWDKIADISVDMFLYIISFVIIAVVLLTSFFYMIKHFVPL